MLRTAVRCPSCLIAIFSRDRHDFRWCECKTTFVDGGMDYLRFGVESPFKLEDVEILKIEVSEEDLEKQKKTLAQKEDQGTRRRPRKRKKAAE